MITAEVQYLVKQDGRPIYYASSAGRDASYTIDVGLETHAVEVRDARIRPEADEKDRDGQHPSGFDLVWHESKVNDFLDAAQIGNLYEPEIDRLLKALTGASRVYIFDHTARASNPELREQKQVREPATMVHNDYTAKSGFVCLKEQLGDEAESLAKGRFQIINVWRPLVDPVVNWPLALCDARSVDITDQVDTERRSATHTGEILLSTHNPQHRWFYYPQMRSDEVLVFKTFDSEDCDRKPNSIHTSIDLPDIPIDTPPRESFETRALVFYQ
ncbi:MAG: CmcJ/NvfI family oxidoreductase [Gammaproteobacteria bacterium]